MTPKELQTAYKSFFVDSPAGKDFITRMTAKTESNLDKAAEQNSTDYLARYKGNKEIADIIEQTIAYEGKSM